MKTAAHDAARTNAPSEAGIYHEVAAGNLRRLGENLMPPRGVGTLYCISRTPIAPNSEFEFGNFGGMFLTVMLTRFLNGQPMKYAFSTAISACAVIAFAQVEAQTIEPLGVTVEHLTPEIAKALQVPSTIQGVVVDRVDLQGPAANILRRGDIISTADGQEIRMPDQLISIIQSRAAAKPTLLLQVIRGKTSSYLSVSPSKIVEPGGNRTQMAKSEPKNSVPGWIGIGIRLASDGREQISSVAPSGPAEKAGIRSGDIFRKINGIAITPNYTASYIIANTGPDKSLNIEIERAGQKMIVQVLTGARPTDSVAAGKTSERAALEARWAREDAEFKAEQERIEEEGRQGLAKLFSGLAAPAKPRPSYSSANREDNPAAVLPGEATQTFPYVADSNKSYAQACAGKTFGVGSRQARICSEWSAARTPTTRAPQAQSPSGSAYNQKPVWDATRDAQGDSGSASTGKMYTSANQCVGYDPQGFLTNSCGDRISVAFCWMSASSGSNAAMVFGCEKGGKGLTSVPAYGRTSFTSASGGRLSFFACPSPANPVEASAGLTGLSAKGCR